MHFLKRLCLAVFVSLIATNVSAYTNSEFCSIHSSTDGLQQVLDLAENQLGFKNSGGLFNGGVCWWHSRFLRNLTYLGFYSPEKAPISRDQIKSLLLNIRKGERVFEIQGFANARDFSLYYQKEIQNLLNDWQIVDGGLRGGWQRGVQGKYEIRADILAKMMDELFTYVDRAKNIAYVKLQMKGIKAHAWLINRIEKNDGGYRIYYIDSNDPGVVGVYSYTNGDTSFTTSDYGKFVPYLEFFKEELRLKEVVRAYCQNERG